MNDLPEQQNLDQPDGGFHSQVPLVSICCITFNHEKFIRDAMEGFLMQKTDFPFEILVHDDASTDETPDILREYQEKHPDLFRIVYQTENQYSKGRKPSTILLPMAKGKYIAICEGDDYWTDPLKLQKQVDFMEAHPECSLSCHNVQKYSQTDHINDGLFVDCDIDRLFDKKDFFKKSMVHTSSMLFRNVPFQDYFNKTRDIKIGDWALQAFLVKLGKIGFLHETMSVYRFHGSGVWNAIDPIARATNLVETMEIVQKVLHFNNESLLNRKLAGYYVFLFGQHYKHKDLELTKKYLKKAIFKIKYLTKEEKLKTRDIFGKVYFIKQVYLTMPLLAE